METTTKGFKAVYALVPRPDGRDFFMRVGGAFSNKDGSLTLLLDAIPLSGRLQVRDYQPRAQTEAQGAEQPRAGVV